MSKNGRRFKKPRDVRKLAGATMTDEQLTFELRKRALRNALDRVLEDGPISDEDWDVLIRKILAIRSISRKHSHSDEDPGSQPGEESDSDKDRAIEENVWRQAIYSAVNRRLTG